MRKAILFTTALIFSLSILSAQPRNGKGDFRSQGQNFEGRSQMALNLTDEQEEAIKESRLQHAKKTLKIKNELGVLAAERRGLSTGDNQDLNDIDKNIDKMQELRSGLMKMNARHRLEVRDVLTDEQKIMFDTRQTRGHKQSMGKRPGMQRSNAQRQGMQKPNRAGGNF